MKTSLAGKVALVAGATRGAGRGIPTSPGTSILRHAVDRRKITKNFDSFVMLPREMFMRTLFHALLLCGLSVIFAGCAGIGIVARSDPAAKLRDAGDLFDRQDRPLIAERLIREAIGSYQKTNDQLGLANAYRTYGFFFRSTAIEGQWSKYYRENGFLDKSASFDGRYGKSIEYFEKARTIFAEYNRFDALTNVNLNIGFTYEVMGYGAAACEAFDRSLENNQDNLRQISKAKVALPQGFATYEEFLAPHRERAGCLVRHNHPRRRDVVQAG